MKFEIYLYNKGKMPSFYKRAIAEYEKRLSRYGKISLYTIKKEKDWNKKIEEAEEGFFLIPGTSDSSEGLSERIAQWERESRKSVSFYIEESLSEKQDGAEVSSNPVLQTYSISDFQMNGPMMAMVLYEQIYRGYRIMHNHPYHK